jgi:hypothetical protein
LFAVVVPFHQEGIFGGKPGKEMSTLHGQPPFKRRLTGVVGFSGWHSGYSGQIGAFKPVLAVSLLCSVWERKPDFGFPLNLPIPQP